MRSPWPWSLKLWHTLPQNPVFPIPFPCLTLLHSNYHLYNIFTYLFHALPITASSMQAPEGRNVFLFCSILHPLCLKHNWCKVATQLVPVEWNEWRREWMNDCPIGTSYKTPYLPQICSSSFQYLLVVSASSHSLRPKFQLLPTKLLFIPLSTVKLF